MSFRARVAIFGAAIVALTLVLFSILLYVLAAISLGVNENRDLLQRVQTAEASIATARRATLLQPQPPIAPADLADTNDVFVEVLDASGMPISSTALLNGQLPQIPSSALHDGSPSMVTLAPGVSVRLVVRPWTRADLGASGYVVVGQGARAGQAAANGVRGFLWISGIVTLIAAGLAMWLVAGRAVRPLELVARTAEEIRRTGDTSQRLPVSDRLDELDRLARAFNGMLERLYDAQARLAEALEAQRRFVADASHELRTPLTTIRSNAGLLLQRPDVTPADRSAAMRDIASESERMSRMVDDLLTLARADTGQKLELAVDGAAVDIGQLIDEVARQAQQLYVERRVHATSASVAVIGNANALKQLLWILLDNAARFTDPGGRIDIHVSADDGWATLEVIDDGCGIPEAHLEHIFERFFQADTSRAGSGAGLGLSIARWIVAEHGGSICARNNSPQRGATFEVRLPRA